LELSDEEKSRDVRYGHQEKNLEGKAKDSIEYALKHSLERASVIHDRRLLAYAYQHSIGNHHLSVEDINNALEGMDAIIRVNENNRTMITTKNVLEEEKAMVELARNGLQKVDPLYKIKPDIQLEGQQKKAVDYILTTNNRVSIVRGAAGSGKTTLMKEAVRLIEEKGKTVMVVAPTTEASRGVLRDEGFSNAETMAKFLSDPALKNKVRNQVLWVDEAGLIGTQDMKSLLEFARDYNARLILGGDTRQHSSVTRGDALRILNTVGGIKCAEVTKIYRQRNHDYNAAISALSEGDVNKGFQKLDRLGFIKSYDPMNPNKDLINDYISAKKKGKSTLIVSPTHEQSEKVTIFLRERLKDEGLLDKEELNVRRLINKSLTDAQKSDIRNFKLNNVIQFNQNLLGISRGSRWIISDIKDDALFLKDSANNEKQVRLSKIKSFDLFEHSTLTISKGDKVNITKNSFDKNKRRMNNGLSLEVASISHEGEITLRNEVSKVEFKLDKEFGHIKHSYCVTSYASQGKTVDEVFISQPASTFSATNAKQFYVSASRARDKAHIYTDDKVGLLENASQFGDRLSAIELMNKSKEHEAKVRQNEINKTPQVSQELIKRKEEFIKNQIIDRNYEPEF
jgi:ATP-dependent exoDNAse (exonuclease V) alpha subunit